MSEANEAKRLLDDALNQVRAGQLAEAEQLLLDFLQQFPDCDLADNAHYNLAQIYQRQGDQQRALEQLTIVVERFPNSDACYFAKDERIELMRQLGIGPTETPDERYQMGKEAYARGDFDEAIGIFDEFLNRYPDSDLADNVHYNLAKIYKKRGDADRVRMHVQTIMQRFPDSDAATYAEELLEDL